MYLQQERESGEGAEGRREVVGEAEGGREGGAEGMYNVPALSC